MPQPRIYLEFILTFLLGALAFFGLVCLFDPVPLSPAASLSHYPFLILGGLAGVIWARHPGAGRARRTTEAGWTFVGLMAFSTLGGALLLSSLSALQKFLAGYPIKPAGFVVPVCFGAGFGVLFGLYLQKTHNALREQTQSRKRLSLILQSLHDGVIVTDAAGRIELTNPAARALVPGFEELRPDEHLDEALARLTSPLEPSAEAMPPPHSPVLLATKARGRVLRGKAVPLFDLEGVGTGAVLVLEDVTFEHKIERLKSEFIIAAAHELKTPITVLSGFAEMLLDDRLDPEQRRDGLTRIHENAWQLNRILDVLLDISCVDSGLPLPLERHLHTVAELLDGAREYSRSTSTPQRFDFAVVAPDCRLIADKVKIAQVFINLLSNAVKFSPPSGVIRVTGAPEGGRYRFEVADQGVGMSEEEKARVFDRFFRADASDTALGGIGLGMSLVKAIIEAHGGEIWLDSQPGRGTRVSFALPLATEPSGANPAG